MLPPPEPEDLESWSAAAAQLVRSLADYRAQHYRCQVIEAIKKRRDRYPSTSPEWQCLDQFVRDLTRAVPTTRNPTDAEVEAMGVA